MHSILRSMKLVALASALAAANVHAEPAYTAEFPLERCQFAPWGGNAFFSLQPGRQSYFTNKSCVDSGRCDELEELWISVLPETRRVAIDVEGRRRTVLTRVVQERETADGELVEVSRNFFAVCHPSRDVYYFGEDVDIYEDGQIVSNAGAWLAGRHGARPGILMPDGAFLLGSRYFQEIAPGIALDRAEHVGTNLEVTVPAGHYAGCIRIDETTPLEPGAVSVKVYCPHVGLVKDGNLELTAVYGAASRAGGDD